MGAKLRIIAPNYADDAVLTDSPAMAAALPVANLQDSARARVARSVGLPAPQYVRGNWNESKAVNGFAIWRHNLRATALVRLKLWANQNQAGTLLYDSGAVTIGTIIPYGEFVYGVDVYGGWLFTNWAASYTTLWFDQVHALSFELQMTDAGNPDGYMQVCRLFLGKYWSPSVSHSFGHQMRWQDESTQERTDGNTLRTDPREPFREFRVPVDWLSEADRQALAELIRANGKAKDMFFSLHPDDTGTKGRDYTAACKATDISALVGDKALNFKSELVLAEA